MPLRATVGGVRNITRCSCGAPLFISGDLAPQVLSSPEIALVVAANRRQGAAPARCHRSTRHTEPGIPDIRAESAADSPVSVKLPVSRCVWANSANRSTVRLPNLQARPLSRNAWLVRVPISANALNRPKLTQKGATLASRPQLLPMTGYYFKLVIAVRSNESLAIPAAPHQLEPTPVGLIGVTLVVPVPLKAPVKALQLPLFRSVSE